MASRIDLIIPHGDPVHASRRPVSILLDEQRPHFTDCRNETTATAKSRAGYTISVSFWMADPPEMSFFSVHCTKPPGSKSRTAAFNLLPHVVGAEGRFVLLRARFSSGYGRDEYFMYQVGDGQLPSLEPIPLPDADDDTGTGMVKDFGIVPRGHGGHYLLAALSEDHDAPSDYHLQLYSSKNKSWSTRTLLDPSPGVERITPEKVIRLEEGILGWVDFSQGLLVCDLREDPPSVHFIPLPKPLPENRDKLKLPSTGASARSFRDTTCVNGLLKFIEMVHFQVTEEPSDSGDEEYLYDSDLIRSLKRKHVDEKPKPRHGWRAVTWTRMVSSDCWRKGYVVDVADVSVDASAHSLLLSGLRDANFGKLTFRDLYSAFPTLSTCPDDTLYLKTMVEPSDQSGWVVAVDLGSKTVKALGVYSFEGHDPFKQPFRTCALPCHLNITPGVKVSACREITQSCMDEPILGQPRCKSVSPLHKRIKHARNGGQSSIQKDQDHIPQVHTVQNNMVESSKLQRPLDEKNNPSQNEAQSIVRNDHISQVCHVQNSLVESTGKLSRPTGEETNCSLNEDQCVVQSDHVSLIRPQNNLKFKWDRPMYPGQSWWMYPGQPRWHHQHMPFQRPQQLLESTVPSDPGYAQLAPAPSLHGYVNYQPVWQQPLPTMGSGFGSHEVPQTCFNECHGASYHGYSQQLLPPKSFAHGAHSSYGNNQPQWQNQWHIQDVPAYASWQHPDQVPY